MQKYITYENARLIDGYIENNYHQNLFLVCKEYGSFKDNEDATDVEIGEEWVIDIKKTIHTKNKCVCSHKISENYFATNSQTNNTILLGSTCYKKVNNNEIYIKMLNAEMNRRKREKKILIQEQENTRNYRMGMHTKYPNMTLVEIYKKNKNYVIWLSEHCKNKTTKKNAEMFLSLTI